MDEPSKNISSPLDESSDRRMRENKTRGNKELKCRSHMKSKSRFVLGNTIPKSSTKSDSESSLDAWIDGQMDVSVTGSYHTDSDDIFCNVNDHLTSWRHCSPNFVESDSVNENLNLSREPRRKRKFKRMTVDPPFVTDHKSLPSAAAFIQKTKRWRNLKSPKLPKISTKPKLARIVSQLSSEMENFCMEFGNVATSSGKRKRCAHEKSVECNGCGCKTSLSCKDNSEIKIVSNPFHLLDHSKPKPQEINSSGLSSSESECGILTNDEGREADDEHSDFFQESGPPCGTSNLSPYWQDDCIVSDEEEEFSEPKFPELLTASFRHISPDKYYRGPPVKNENRLVREGRRRLGNKLTYGTDEVFPYLPLTNDYSCFLSSGENCLTKTIPNEKKKRKGDHGDGEFPSTEANLGFLNLKKSSWIPAMDLGRSEEEVSSSSEVLASDRKNEPRKANKRELNAVSATVPPENPC